MFQKGTCVHQNTRKREQTQLPWGENTCTQQCTAVTTLGEEIF